MYPNLKAEMVRKSITLEKLAEVAGVAYDTAGKWLNTDTQMKAGNCLLIREELFPDMDYRYLFDYQTSNK